MEPSSYVPDDLLKNLSPEFASFVSKTFSEACDHLSDEKVKYVSLSEPSNENKILWKLKRIFPPQSINDIYKCIINITNDQANPASKTDFEVLYGDIIRNVITLQRQRNQLYSQIPDKTFDALPLSKKNLALRCMNIRQVPLTQGNGNLDTFLKITDEQFMLIKELPLRRGVTMDDETTDLLLSLIYLNIPSEDQANNPTRPRLAETNTFKDEEEELFSLAENLPEPIAKEIYLSIKRGVAFETKDKFAKTERKDHDALPSNFDQLYGNTIDNLINLQMEQNNLAAQVPNELLKHLPKDTGKLLKDSVKHVAKTVSIEDPSSHQESRGFQDEKLEKLIVLMKEQNMLVKELPLSMENKVSDQIINLIQKSIKDNVARFPFQNQDISNTYASHKTEAKSFENEIKEKVEEGVENSSLLVEIFAEKPFRISNLPPENLLCSKFNRIKGVLVDGGISSKSNEEEKIILRIFVYHILQNRIISTLSSQSIENNLTPKQVSHVNKNINLAGIQNSHIKATSQLEEISSLKELINDQRKELRKLPYVQSEEDAEELIDSIRIYLAKNTLPSISEDIFEEIGITSAPTPIIKASNEGLPAPVNNAFFDAVSKIVTETLCEYKDSTEKEIKGSTSKTYDTEVEKHNECVIRRLVQLQILQNKLYAMVSESSIDSLWREAQDHIRNGFLLSNVNKLGEEDNQIPNFNSIALMQIINEQFMLAKEIPFNKVCSVDKDTLYLIQKEIGSKANQLDIPIPSTYYSPKVPHIEEKASKMVLPQTEELKTELKGAKINLPDLDLFKKYSMPSHPSPSEYKDAKDKIIFELLELQKKENKIISDITQDKLDLLPEDLREYIINKKKPINEVNYSHYSLPIHELKNLRERQKQLKNELSCVFKDDNLNKNFITQDFLDKMTPEKIIEQKCIGAQTNMIQETQNNSQTVTEKTSQHDDKNKSPINTQSTHIVQKHLLNLSIASYEEKVKNQKANETQEITDQEINNRFSVTNLIQKFGGDQILQKSPKRNDQSDISISSVSSNMEDEEVKDSTDDSLSVSQLVEKFEDSTASPIFPRNKSMTASTSMLKVKEMVNITSISKKFNENQIRNYLLTFEELKGMNQMRLHSVIQDILEKLKETSEDIKDYKISLDSNTILKDSTREISFTSLSSTSTPDDIKALVLSQQDPNEEYDPKQLDELIKDINEKAKKNPDEIKNMKISWDSLFKSDPSTTLHTSSTITTVTSDGSNVDELLEGMDSRYQKFTEVPYTSSSDITGEKISLMKDIKSFVTSDSSHENELDIKKIKDDEPVIDSRDKKSQNKKSQAPLPNKRGKDKFGITTKEISPEHTKPSDLESPRTLSDSNEVLINSIPSNYSEEDIRRYLLTFTMFKGFDTARLSLIIQDILRKLKESPEGLKDYKISLDSYPRRPYSTREISFTSISSTSTPDDIKALVLSQQDPNEEYDPERLDELIKDINEKAKKNPDEIKNMKISWDSLFKSEPSTTQRTSKTITTVTSDASNVEELLEGMDPKYKKVAEEIYTSTSDIHEKRKSIVDEIKSFVNLDEPQVTLPETLVKDLKQNQDKKQEIDSRYKKTQKKKSKAPIPVEKHNNNSSISTKEVSPEDIKTSDLESPRTLSDSNEVLINSIPSHYSEEDIRRYLLTFTMFKGFDTARLSLIIQDILRKLKESPEGLKDYKISLDSYPRRPYSTREISFTSISSTSTPDDIKALVLSQQDPNEEYDPERLDELIKDINEKAKKNPDEIKNMKISWASLFKSEPSTTRRTSKTITTVTSDTSNVEELLEGMDPKYKKVTEVTYTSSSDMPEEKRSFMDKIKSFVTSDSSDEKETEKLVGNIKTLKEDEPVIDSSEKKSQKKKKKNKSPPVSEEKPEETIPSTLSAPKELISKPMKDTTEGAPSTPVEEEKDIKKLPEPESSKVSKKKKKSKVPLPTEKDNDQPSISTKEVSPEDIKTSDLESPRTLSDSSEVLINSIPSNYSEEDIRRYLLTFTMFKGFDTARLSLIIQDILRKLKESPEGLKDYKISLDSYPRRPYSTREISFTSISSTSTPDDIKALVLSQQDPNEEYDPERLDELIKDINEKAKKNPDEIKNMKISWASLFKSEPSTTRRTSKTITTVTSDASNVEELLEGMDPKYKKVTEVTYTSSSDMLEEKRSFMDKIKAFVTSDSSDEKETEKLVENIKSLKEDEPVIDSSEKKSQKKKKKNKSPPVSEEKPEETIPSTLSAPKELISKPMKDTTEGAPSTPVEEEKDIKKLPELESSKVSKKKKKSKVPLPTEKDNDQPSISTKEVSPEDIKTSDLESPRTLSDSNEVLINSIPSNYSEEDIRRYLLTFTMFKGFDTARLSLIIQDILRKLKESPEGLKDYKISLDSYPRRPYSTREISFTSISSTSTPDDIKALVLSQQDPNEEYDPERLDELIKDINEKAKKNPDEIKNMKISWASLFKSEPSTTRRTSKTITTVTSDASNVEELLEGMDPKYKKVTEVTYTSSSDMLEEKRSFMDKIKAFVTSDSSDEKETEKLVENIKSLKEDEPVIDSSEKKSQKKKKKNKSPPVSEEKPEETIPSTLSAPKELISKPMKDTTEGAPSTPVEEEKDIKKLPELESSKVSKKKKKSKVPLPTEKDNDQPSISTKEVSPEDIKTSDLESPRTLSDSNEVLINSIPSNYSEEDIRRYLLTFTMFKGFDTARLSLIIQDILRKLKESPEGLKDYKISLDSYPRRPYSTREISFTSISSTSTPDDIKALVLSQQDPNEEYDPERLDELIKDINEKAKKNPDEIKNMKISWASLFKSEPSTTRRTSKTITTVTSDASNVEELLEGMDPKYKKVTEVTYTSSSDMLEEKRSFMDKIKAFVTSDSSDEKETEKLVENIKSLKEDEPVIDSSEKKSQKKKKKNKSPPVSEEKPEETIPSTLSAPKELISKPMKDTTEGAPSTPVEEEKDIKKLPELESSKVSKKKKKSKVPLPTEKDNDQPSISTKEVSPEDIKTSDLESPRTLSDSNEVLINSIPSNYSEEDIRRYLLTFTMFKGFDTARLSLIIQDILRKLKESPEGLKDYKISLDSYPRRPYSTREISFTSISSTSTPDDIKALVLSQQDPNEEYDPERLDELIKDINEKAKKNPDEIKNMKISWASLFKSEPSTTRRTSKTITTVTSDASNVEELLEGMDPKYKKVTEVTYTSSSDMLEEKRSFMDKIKAFVTSDSSDEKQ
nr:uncharacterized protein LOC121124402 [Lepeophtheirus salmonis]